jgi:hypothetical protein
MARDNISPDMSNPPRNLYMESDPEGKEPQQVFPGDVNRTEYQSEVERGRFHINNLRKQFRDLARPNMFVVKCNMPGGGDEPFIIDMVKTATLPSVEVGKITLSRCGMDFNVPGDAKFGDLSVTFWADADMQVRKYFHDWHINFTNNYFKHISGLPNLAKAGTVFVEQLDSNYNITYACKFINCWPSQIGDIALSHDTENSRSEFQVQFAYSYFEIYQPKGK